MQMVRGTNTNRDAAEFSARLFCRGREQLMENLSVPQPNLKEWTGFSVKQGVFSFVLVLAGAVTKDGALLSWRWLNTCQTM